VRETAELAAHLMARDLRPRTSGPLGRRAPLPPRVVERFGSVDGLINCAGVIQPFVRLHDMDYAAIDRVFDINWHGTLYMTKAFLPLLLARPRAHIVNVSSMGGFIPVPGQTVYGASKAAVKLFTEGLHSELKDTKVHVTCVPGAVGTNIAANAGVKSRAGADARQAKVGRRQGARIISTGWKRTSSACSWERRQVPRPAVPAASPRAAGVHRRQDGGLCPTRAGGKPEFRARPSAGLALLPGPTRAGRPGTRAATRGGLSSMAEHRMWLRRLRVRGP